MVFKITWYYCCKIMNSQIVLIYFRVQNKKNYTHEIRSKLSNNNRILSTYAIRIDRCRSTSSFKAEHALSYIYRQNTDFLFFYGKKFTPDEEFILDMIQDLFCDLIKCRKKLGETDNIRLYLMKSFRRKLLRGIESKRRSAKLESDTIWNQK